MTIHPTAIIDKTATIGQGCQIGAYCFVGPKAVLGEHNILHHHAIIGENTRLGDHNEVFPYACVGLEPQDKKHQKGDKVYATLGDHNIIREFVTISRGTLEDRGDTVIGNHNLLMSYVHIAHDCVLGNHTVFANNASLAGHVQVEDYASLGGFCLVNQFRTIGKHCFIGMGCSITSNLLPFMCYAEDKGTTRLKTANIVGLKRLGFDRKEIVLLNKFCELLSNKKIKTSTLKKELANFPQNPCLSYLKDFLSRSIAKKQGFIR